MADITAVIDCDADPWLPKGWTILAHKRMGRVLFDSNRLELHVFTPDDGAEVVYAGDVHTDVMNRAVMNACVLDYLLANKHLIPEEWMPRNSPWDNKAFIFWGTIYMDENGHQTVRCLAFSPMTKDWEWRLFYLDGEILPDESPAVLIRK